MIPKAMLFLAAGLMLLALACKNGESEPSPTATSAEPPTATAPVDHSAEIQAELPAYASAVTAGDGEYLRSHLHSTALHFYGAETCQAWFDNIGGDPTFALEVHSISGPAPWTWGVYGETIATVPDVYTVAVTMTRNGVPAEVEAHFTWNAEKGEIRGFSPCIPPPS
jgi:hypothetical protein